MIIHRSDRHSIKKKEVSMDMEDLPELRIIQQREWYDGYLNQFVDYCSYLRYGKRVLLAAKDGTTKDYSMVNWKPGLFKESDPGTVLSFTQE